MKNQNTILGMEFAPRFLLMLQAFADPNTVTTGSTDTSGTGSDISPELRAFYHRDLLENAYPNLVHEQFATMYPIPAGGGQTINMRRMEKLPDIDPTNPLTEGVTPDGGTLRITQEIIELEQFGYWVGISDKLNLTAPDPLLTELVGELGHQGSNLRDKYIRYRLGAAQSVIYAPKAAGDAVTSDAGVDATCRMTVRLLRAAAAQLKASDIKPFEDGTYVWIAHPYVIEDLKNDSEWKDWTAYTEGGVKRMYRGEVGMIEGIRCVESTNALITKNATTGMAIFNNFIFGKGTYGVTGIEGEGLETVIKPFGSGDDPLNQRMTAGWKTLVGAKILNTVGLINVKTGSSRGTTVAAN